jgi:SAM-dependent methyltransferase
MSGFSDPDRLSELYRERFGDHGEDVASRARQTTWQVLCESWFPRYIAANATVLEMGTGRGEFINNVRAGRKLAVDLNEDAANYLDADIEFHQASVTDMSEIPDDSIDVVFSSNLMEHLGTAETLLTTLAESRRVLRPTGLLISLVPNAKYVGMDFYDFLDHTLPLTEVSFGEALALSDFEQLEMIPRFLPYSAQNLSRAPSAGVIRAYLKARPAWRILGKQFFSVAQPSGRRGN